MQMTTKAMRRAERAATALKQGEAILSTLKGARRLLVAAAKKPRPPVAAVSELLRQTHPDVVWDTPVRQFVGIAVRGLLEEAGFEIAYGGVRLVDDPIFRTGAVYRPRTAIGETKTADDFFDRLVRHLKPTEAERIIAALATYFPESLAEGAAGLFKPRSRSSR